ncbi:hypothetical protein HK098_007747 [Nowakowskiella sp. JEL0407]|nr:hypothetical protein HK098_007747 [Nowakowskiella sp. JEL0407]
MAKYTKRFKQQQLIHKTLLLTPRTVLPTLLLVGLLCFASAALLFWASKNVLESRIDYENCKKLAPLSLTKPSISSYPITLWKFNNSSNTCTIRFTVSSTLPAPVLMYIRLSNFLQNHRLYTKSYSEPQLKSLKVLAASELGQTSTGNPVCGFLQYANCTENGNIRYVSDTSRTGLDKYNIDCYSDVRDDVVKNAGPGAQYFPCGLIANSMFSDVISPLRCVNSSVCTKFEFSETGIAFPEDAERYSSTNAYNATPELQAQIPRMLIPPPNWRKVFKQWSNGYNSTNLPNLKNWERFQVWMRPAGLSTFRKTWGRNPKETLQAGEYEIDIVDNFDTLRFGGTKSLIFSTVSPVGSSNYNFLAIAFLSCGCVAVVAAIVFFALSYTGVGSRKPGDHSSLSWIKKDESKHADPSSKTD